jgi:hypothetical protein
MIGIDDRPDEARGRPHVEISTEIEIAPNKLKWDRSNPDCHSPYTKGE